MNQTNKIGVNIDPTLEWVDVCPASEIDVEEVRRFDFGSSTFAIYRTEDGYHATDGWCTHEKAHLADGFVLDDVIECPLHNGRFHIPTGKALNPPVCINLKTYPVRVDDGILKLGFSQHGS
jgi:3-phenylpropionate/trans-cinnamate dioxygenase ferredoxin component